MAAQNQMINRLHQQRSKTKGMLTPGLKKRAGDQGAGSVSSLFTRFGGGKFQLAARKMRYLDDKKLGNFHSESRKKFSRAIPEKYRNIQSLIHIRPRFSPQESIWSELEKVFPTSQGGRFESPTQPGELGRGSVIQKIPMFPKPGQSIESFREQARSIPRRPKRQIPSQQPKLDPKSRLFTRIQEISDHDQQIVDTPYDAYGDTGKKDEGLATSAQPTRDDRVQRQVESQSPPEIAVPEEISADFSEPPATHMEGSPDQTVTEQPDSSETLTPTEIPVSPETIPSPPRLKSAKPVKIERLGKPAVRELPIAKPAPQAKPVPVTLALSKAKPLVQRVPETSPPKKVQRPEPAREVATPPEIRAPQLPRILDEVAPTTPPPAPKEETEPFLEEATFPTPTPDTMEETTPAPPLEPAVDTAQAPQQLEIEGSTTPMDLPLRKVVESRKQVAKTLKSLEPESLAPTVTPRQLVQRTRPLIPTQKYRPGPRPASRQKESTISQSLSQLADLDPALPSKMIDRSRGLDSEDIQSSQTSDTFFRQEESPTTATTEPLRLSLAYTSSPGQPIPKARPETHLTPIPQVQQQYRPPLQEELPPQLSPELEPTKQPIVQRQWEEPGETVSKQIVRRQDEPDIESEPEKADIDLNQLAEDVLPIVKRILEIESERLSR